MAIKLKRCLKKKVADNVDRVIFKGHNDKVAYAKTNT